jgi:hypothetical protein
MRVEDLVNRGGGLKLGHVFLSRWVSRGNFSQNSIFEMAAGKNILK